MRAQPTRGRYSPLNIGTFASMTRGWSLASRHPRLLRNPPREGFDDSVRPIARLRPGRDVTLFSLPTNVAMALGMRAATKALKPVATWNNAAPSMTRDHTRSIVVYLEETTRLRVMDDRVTLSRRKFGSGEGLATSSKPNPPTRLTCRFCVRLERTKQVR
jgi:hypothetical protein